MAALMLSSSVSMAHLPCRRVDDGHRVGAAQRPIARKN
jgi:hypothetical protein